MSASKLFPKTYKGKVESGGYVYKNYKPKGANSPDMRGMMFVAEPGWYWVGVWSHGRKGFHRVALDGLTDDQARKYCAPRGGAAPNGNGHAAPQQTTLDSQPGDDSDIPF